MKLQDLTEAKRDSSKITNLQITEIEKIELMVTHMTESGDMKFISVFTRKFHDKATDEQKKMFPKLYDLGWNLSKVLWSKKTGKIAWGMYANGTSAWVTPDGKITRAELGKRTAYLKDSDWVDQ
jgi:hypothetical protein